MEKVDEAAEEIKKRRKKRTIKVAITEGLMVVAVFLMVTATTFIAIGYNVNPKNDWSVERTGLVQIQSFPTGATVNLDGENLFAWTNMSRSMAEGEHQIVLSKDGYDSWTKKIAVTAGIYYRLTYPKLFLKEKKTEKIADFSKMRMISFAKDGKQLLAIPEEELVWHIWKINEDAPSATDVDFSEILPTEIDEIEILGWSGNNERLLLKVNGEWILLNIKQPKESINLSKKFGLVFSDIKIANDAASELFVLCDGELRRINVDEGEISGVLVESVESFSNLKTDVVYTTKPNEKGEFLTGIYRNGEKNGTVLSEFVDEKGEVRKLVGVGEYFGEFYIVEAMNDEIGIYRGEKLPSSGEEVEMEAVKVEKLGFIPEKIEVVGGGGLFVMSGEGQKAVFDVETESVVKITTLSNAKWLDEFMLYQIGDGRLNVMDFDGENRREIADGVNEKTEVKISKNNKWLYFISSENELSRTRIAE